jgi:hypothetical protein
VPVRAARRVAKAARVELRVNGPGPDRAIDDEQDASSNSRVAVTPRLLNPQIANADWMFEVVFEYGEDATDSPMPNDAGTWPARSDPFSSRAAAWRLPAGLARFAPARF